MPHVNQVASFAQENVPLKPKPTRWEPLGFKKNTPERMIQMRQASGVTGETIMTLREQRRVHQAARRGVEGGARPLPHADVIQKHFGKHDVSGIKAHVGGAAREASEHLGALAYATGDHVAFKQAPDLHLAAHEAAHVIQQRAGVQLKGGIGEANDTYERHADSVADAVVAGRSAEPLLDKVAGSAGSKASSVQTKKEANQNTSEPSCEQGCGCAGCSVASIQFMFDPTSTLVTGSTVQFVWEPPGAAAPLQFKKRSKGERALRWRMKQISRWLGKWIERQRIAGRKETLELSVDDLLGEGRLWKFGLKGKREEMRQQAAEALEGLAGKGLLKKVRQDRFKVLKKPNRGTSNTTAPVLHSKMNIRHVWNKEVQGEVAVFRAGVRVMNWLNRTRLKGRDAANQAEISVTTAEVFAARGTRLGLSPRPRSAEDIAPVLEMLSHHGALRGSGGSYVVVLDPNTGQVASEAFLGAQNRMGKFAKKFERRVKRKSPSNAIVETDLLPLEYSSGRKSKEKAGEERAHERVEALKTKLQGYVVYRGPGKYPLKSVSAPPKRISEEGAAHEVWEIPISWRRRPYLHKGPIELVEKVADGTRKTTVNYRQKLEEKLAKAKKKHFRSQNYRRFAKPVTALLKKMSGMGNIGDCGNSEDKKKRKPGDFKGGNYTGHSWGAFSVDVFLRGRHYMETEDGKKPKDMTNATWFYNRNNARAFFARLNQACEEGAGGYEKFAWRALYNDPVIAREMNAKYGAKRVSITGKHGPGSKNKALSKKLHIHLDLLPVGLQRDEKTGYDIHQGRVKLRE